MENGRSYLPTVEPSDTRHIDPTLSDGGRNTANNTALRMTWLQMSSTDETESNYGTVSAFYMSCATIPASILWTCRTHADERANECCDWFVSVSPHDTVRCHLKRIHSFPNQCNELCIVTPLRRLGMARVIKWSHSFTCTPCVHPLT